MDQLHVRVRNNDNVVCAHLLRDLVPNRAYVYLLQNPDKIGTQCNGEAKCPGAATCCFVHFNRDSKISMTTLVKVQQEDGSIIAVSTDKLVLNKAYFYLAAHPNQSGKVCRGHPRGVTAEQCNFVHYLPSANGDDNGGKKSSSSSSSSTESPATPTTTAGDVVRNSGASSSPSAAVAAAGIVASFAAANAAAAAAASSGGGEATPTAAAQAVVTSPLCCVCGEDFSKDVANPLGKIIVCDHGHVCCSPCKSRYISEIWCAVPITPGKIPNVACVALDCKAPPIRPGHLARAIEPDAFEAYLAVHQRAVEAKAFTEVSERLTPLLIMADHSSARTAVSELEAITINRAIGASAFMCPNCKMGPILREGCDDLLAHHNAQVGTLKGTRNNCPRCKMLVPSITAWKKWDGIVRLDMSGWEPEK